MKSTMLNDENNENQTEKQKSANQILTSSFVEETLSPKRANPSTLSCFNPIIPSHSTVNLNTARGDKKRMSERYTKTYNLDNIQRFRKQISLNQTGKGNKNVNIVILDRDTPAIESSSRRVSGLINNFKQYTITEENPNDDYVLTTNPDRLFKERSRSSSTLRPNEENEMMGIEIPKQNNSSDNETDKEINSEVDDDVGNDETIKINKPVYENSTEKSPYDSDRENQDKSVADIHLPIPNTKHGVYLGSNKSTKVKPPVNKLELSEIKIVDLDEKITNVPTTIEKDTSKTNLVKIQGVDFNTNFNYTQISYRRYKRKDISKGKNFFKYRYISEKLIESNNINDPTAENEKNFYFYADDRNVIKFTCLFLQKLEKAIFLFNTKKPDDSYKYLLESQIIKNEDEFAEILLIFRGFDKYTVGDFLAKEKNPNAAFKVTKCFISKMDFREEKFLSSFRFLLSRINLPKDSSLILNIIDVFSNVYYSDNCNSKTTGLFKDTTAVYLFASTILALNTLFHRNVPNVQMIKREDFIKMNSNVEQSLAESVYEEIKGNKLDIIHDYNELIYKRLEIKSNDILDEHRRYESLGPGMTSGGRNETIPMDADEMIQMLTKGEIFLKYGRNGDPHERLVFLTKDKKNIAWKGLSCFSMGIKAIKTESVKNVFIGTSNSHIFDRFRIPPEYDLNCFSIIGSSRSLDLRHENPTLVSKWYQALKFVIKGVVSLSEIKKKKTKELTNKKEILSDFWRTEILPNWGEYRKFILIKNRSEFFSNSEVYRKKVQQFNDSLIVKNIKLTDENKKDVVYLWTLGIPDWLRKKLWPLVISNDLDINENLFGYFLKNVEEIEFDNGTVIDRQIMNKVTSGNEDNIPTVSEFDGIPILEKNKMIVNMYNNIDSPILNEIILDVHKSYKKFEYAIKNNGPEMTERIFKEDLFKILRAFSRYRPDISHSRQIAYVSTVFYLNSDDFFEAFKMLCNFVIPSFLIKFLVKDEVFIKLQCDFFEILLKKNVPSVFQHFRNLGISIGLFFYDWIEFLFTKTFKYDTLVRIWDCLLAKGEIFLYEVGLAIIKLQEKEIINSPVKLIFEMLATFPSKYSEDELFNTIDHMNIVYVYDKLIDQNNLAKEKSQLYEAFLYD